VVVVPSTLALLPAYAGLRDPVPELRGACAAATVWLVEQAGTVAVVAAPVRADNLARGVTEGPGARIARHLLAQVGWSGGLVEPGAAAASAWLVVANGSAKRSERAPGHLDDRAAGFDGGIDRALRTGDPEALARLDATLGEELWAFDVSALQQLGSVVPPPTSVTVDYADDPYGVQCWVVRWTCGS